MRPVPQSMVDALAGSNAGASVIFNAWYDNNLVAPGLDVASWSITWTGDQSTKIQGKLSLTVMDSTGALAPWGLDEPLAAAGSEIQCQFQIGTDTTPLGWYPISANKPDETWQIKGPALSFVSGGASIPVDADDRTLLVDDSKFMAPEAPPAGTTAIVEIKRILSGILPVTVASGVTDVSVPSSLTYTNDRIGALYDLVRLVGWCRMTGDGQLEIYSTARTAPVWTVQAAQGTPTGVLVSLHREQARADLHNAVVSTSTQATPEVIGYAYTSIGAARFDGPLKRKPAFHNAIATDQAGVNRDATTYLATLVQNSTLTLKVICLPNPQIQVGDWVRVAAPTIAGKAYPLDGLVTRVKMSGDTNGLDAMELDVQCAAADVQAVAQWLREQQ